MRLEGEFALPPRTRRKGGGDAGSGAVDIAFDEERGGKF